MTQADMLIEGVLERVADDALSVEVDGTTTTLRYGGQRVEVEAISGGEGVVVRFSRQRPGLRCPAVRAADHLPLEAAVLRGLGVTA